MIRESDINIQEIFEPIGLERFLKDYYGNSWCKWDADFYFWNKLFSIDNLNELLTTHRIEYPRLRLAKDGESIPEDQYLDKTIGRRENLIPKINLANFYQKLKEGCTLVLDAVDEMHWPLKLLKIELERTLEESVQMNAYASWGFSEGFGIHWDDHDVMIIQFAGEKHWKIYEPTRRYPLYEDIEFSNKNSLNLVWNGQINKGNILYLPRGWWHTAYSKGSLSLHITIGINKKTGINLFEWLKEKLVTKEIFRKDLPRFKNESEKTQYMISWKDEVKKIVESESLLDEYYSHLRSTKRQFREVDLNYLLLDKMSSYQHKHIQSCVNIPGEFNVDNPNKIFYWRVNEKVYTFSILLFNFINHINNGNSIKLDKALDDFNISENEFLPVLENLMADGLIVLK